MPDWTDKLQVFCADIGSIPKEKFAWARRLPSGADEEIHASASIESLAGAVVYQLERKLPVALGLEMPLFAPVPVDSRQLGRARPSDVNAPAWSSQTGASVMATGIVQVAWILRFVRERAPDAHVYLEWNAFAAAQEGIFLGEAFVTRDAKGATHEEDATIGLDAFCSQLPTPGDPEADETEAPLSIAAAAAMWAGWELASEDLRRPCVLVRA